MCDVEDHGEYIGVNFVKISETCVMQDMFSFEPEFFLQSIEITEWYSFSRVQLACNAWLFEIRICI